MKTLIKEPLITILEINMFLYTSVSNYFTKVETFFFNS